MRILGAMSGWLIAAIAIGVPIAFALLFASVASSFMIGGTATEPAIIAAQLLRGTDSVSMMALPFFILTGEIMNRGGMTKRLIGMFNVSIGRVRGGLGYVVILATFMFGALVGSAVASTAALGAILIPMMAAAGYDRDKAAGLLAGTNMVVPIMPPSIPLIVYGATAGVSITQLFMGSIAPAIYLAILMCGTWFWVSRKDAVQTDVPWPGWGQFFKLVGSGFWAILLPVIILVGLRSGVFTATEAGVVAVVYALFIGLVVYREMKFDDLISAFVAAAKMSAVVMFLAATAQVAGYYMTISGLPDVVAGIMEPLVDNPTMLVFVLMVFVFLLGLILDVIPTILILTPLMVPVLQEAGVDLVWFGIVFTLANVLGLITPPVGPSLNVASAVGKVKIERVSITVLPYLVTQLILLLIFIFIPQTITVPLGWLT
ncbi:tripartite ATP-independent transporter DctM subunit [Trueperella bonasi]|uniref:Tripartite ATP-independent transporter DctM subunit n=1 Tax=Trueperella bonasi TaxID=312286 RepID=A0ABT9NFF3_9ACTO|nr:TRAP transporter large permease [Trueperella bonasi]MDP9806084.1 tripartite ATP-independent transporter DctM subunit [Trueperella bonasi]